MKRIKIRISTRMAAQAAEALSDRTWIYNQLHHYGTCNYISSEYEDGEEDEMEELVIDIESALNEAIGRGEYEIRIEGIE